MLIVLFGGSCSTPDTLSEPSESTTDTNKKVDIKSVNINNVNNYLKDNPTAFLIDVRTEGEFVGGHLPSAKNITLHNIRNKISDLVSDKDKTIFLYCRSGNRSGSALNILKGLGYINAINIGGIISYRGKVEK